jgi:peptidoglycan/LPS O-acetylase OafA/YrhL
MAKSAFSARIPSLDGLRAISIGFVLMGHLVWTRGFPLQSPWAADLAELGVRIFFVISGYLISSLLFADRRRIDDGRLRPFAALKQFYVRRAYRIFPAAYVFLAVMAILDARGVIHLMRHDLLCAATYTSNFHQPRAWWLGHLWSLSVEEQFYMLWPAVVLFAGARRASWVAVAAVALAPAMRVLVWVGWPDLRVHVGEAFPTIFDAIATGCVLAAVRVRLLESPLYLRFTSSWAFAVVPAAVIGAALLSGRPRFDLVVGQAIQNVGIALVIERCIRVVDGRWGRVLNSRPLVFVGTLSYSFYLWQQPFINRHAPGLAQTFPFSVGLAALLALASYTLVEQPFLRLRARRVPTGSALDAAAGARPATVEIK